MEGVSGGLWLDSSRLETVLVHDVWSSLSNGLREEAGQRKMNQMKQRTTNEVRLDVCAAGGGTSRWPLSSASRCRGRWCPRPASGGVGRTGRASRRTRCPQPRGWPGSSTPSPSQPKQGETRNPATTVTMWSIFKKVIRNLSKAKANNVFLLHIGIHFTSKKIGSSLVSTFLTSEITSISTKCRRCSNWSWCSDGDALWEERCSYQRNKHPSVCRRQPLRPRGGCF